MRRSFFFSCSNAENISNWNFIGSEFILKAVYVVVFFFLLFSSDYYENKEFNWKPAFFCCTLKEFNP